MPRTQKQTDATALVNYMNRNNLSTRQAAEALGVSPGGLHGWLKKGSMPCVIARAIAGVEKQKGTPSLFAVVVEEEKLAALKAILDGVGVPYTSIEIR